MTANRAWGEVWKGGARRGSRRLQPALSEGRRWLADNFWGDRGRWPLWGPVAMGTGIATYFSLASEPGWTVVALALGLPAALALGLKCRWRKLSAVTPGGAGGALFAVALLLCCGVGFAAAKMRTTLQAAPVLTREHGPALVTADVEAALRQPGGGWRLILLPLAIEGLDPADLPVRLRLTLRQKDLALAPGQRLRVLAKLGPPPGPVTPQAFDFARQAWFDRIGAVGFSLGRPERIGQAPASGPLDEAKAVLARVRFALAERIRTALPGTTGAVAAALMTGDREAIPVAVLERFRISGLAHLLAISGLHMALFAGLFYAGVHFLLALVEPLALRRPIRKWAAVAGLIGSLGYLLISGASISTQRAFIMVAVMFLAVFFDRQALSMRVVALAAALILLIRPESLLSVGFQMSFAAVIALIAAYEGQQVRRLKKSRGDVGAIRANPYWSRLKFYVLGLVLTSLITDIAIGPFAAFHFNRVAAYGLIANLVAMPIVSVVIMPSAVIAFLLMPFGIESVALAPMGWGIDRVLDVARVIAELPASERLMPSWPVTGLAMIVLGGLWLCLWQHPWRHAGVGILAAGIAVAVTAHPPDILIDREGKSLALRDETGRLHVLPSRRARYAVSTWLRRDGRKEGVGPVSTGGDDGGETAMFRCDASACLSRSVRGVRVSYVQDIRAFSEDCQAADVVVTRLWIPRRLRAACRPGAVVIDGRSLRTSGAVSFRITDGGLIMETAARARGARPWSHFGP